MTEFEKFFEEELQKQIAEVQKPNLFVVGGSGTGKSSLINRVFGKEVALTGNGKPITQGFDKFENDTLDLVFYDTEGYEISRDGKINNNNFQRNIIPKIEKMNKGELKEQVHLVWYCISISNHRVTDYDITNIKYFTSNNMKTAIIFTQCDNDEELSDKTGKDATEFKRVIDSKIPGLTYFETAATVNDLLLDLEKLIEWSIKSLPNDQLRKSFIAGQKTSISSKRKLAYSIVTGFTATTSLTGVLNPIPISDSLLLVPQQLAMCISLTNVFWKGIDLSSTVQDLLEAQIVSLIGKQAASSLLKLIPGLGQIANGIVAGGLTLSLGTAIIESNIIAYTEFLNTGKVPDWTKIFASDVFIQLLSNSLKQNKDQDNK